MTDSVQPDWVLITGASGGFGLEFARQLEERNYNLLLHGRDAARLQMTLDTLKHPERHALIQADLNSRNGIASLLSAIEEKKIVGLVNNAGFGIWGAFDKSGIVPQIDVIKTDLKAPIALTHALLPELLKNNGFLINVSSLAGECPLPYMSTYAAAKAGLSFWSEALRAELSDRLPVVTLVPGPSPTGFREVSGMPKSRGSIFRTDVPLIIRAALICLDRGGGYCVPGWRHKLLFTLQKIVPQTWSLRLMRRYLKP